MRVLGKIWLLGLCLLVLVACGGDAESTETPVPGTPPPATPTAEPTPSLAIQQIIWSQTVDPATGEPTDPVSSFSTESPAIIAVIEVSDVPAGTEFIATWTINDQPVEGLDMTITAENDLPHAWITFSYTRDASQLYPIGLVDVVITSSTGELREASVEIGFP